MSDSPLINTWKRIIKELEENVGFAPYVSIVEIKTDFVGNKTDYNESELQAVKYTEVPKEHETQKEFILEIHDSFSKVAEALVEREAIRSFIHPAINKNPIVSYFIHTTIPCSEYLWSKMLDQLRERYIEYVKQYSELKIGIIRKETNIPFEKTQILRLLHDLNVITPRSLAQLFFWRTMFLSTGAESLEFQEAVIFKHLLTFMTPKHFGYSFKQIKDEIFEQQQIIKIPKKVFDDVFASLIEKLDFRRSLSINWSIAQMCRYLVLLDLDPAFVESRVEFFDFFVKPIRLLATCCLSHCTLCIIFADSRDPDASYLTYLGILKKKRVIVDFQAFIVDSYENCINLNYFSHPEIPMKVLTEDIVKSATFHSEYTQYTPYIDPNHRTTKKEEVRTLIEFLQHSQIQSDTFYPDIAFRKFLEQLSIAELAILFVCIMNHTLRPFTMFPVDKQTIELLQAGIRDSVRIYKRLDARREELNGYLERYPSLKGSLVEFLGATFATLKADISNFFESKSTGAQRSFSIAQLSEWLENRRTSYPVFMQEHGDLMDILFTKMIHLLMEKRERSGQKDLPLSKRFEKLFDELFGDLIKWIVLLRRTGISVLCSRSIDTAVKRIPIFEKVSEGLKTYLGLEKSQFENKLSELIQYAGEMRAVDLNLFRSTLFAKDVFYSVLNVPETDARIQQLKKLFFYLVKFRLKGIQDSDPPAFTYLRIQIPPSTICEFRRRWYAAFSMKENYYLSDPTGLHLLFSLTTTDLLMKVSAPSDELASISEFGSRERSWIASDDSYSERELSRAQKEKLKELNADIETQHEFLLKKRGVQNLFATPYPTYPPEKRIPKELIDFIKNTKKTPDGGLATLSSFKSCLRSLVLNIIPSRFALEKSVLVIRSRTVDLYPDRLCKSGLGILFCPGLHSLRYGGSGRENWLIIQYYLPLNYEGSPQGFKKVLDALEEYPGLSFEYFKADAEAVYYNFDLYLNGNWINLDFVLESRFKLANRDFEYLKSYLKEMPLNNSTTQRSITNEIELLHRFQNASFDERLEMVPQMQNIIPNKAMIDIELVPEAFDFQYSFTILAHASDLSVLEKVKIFSLCFPKSMHLSVSLVRSSVEKPKAKTGVIIMVDSGIYSIRYTIFGLYSYLKTLGCESVMIFTGLSDPLIMERSISFFKQKSWTAWYPSSTESISFFPLIGRYSFSLNSEDLMVMYTMAQRMNLFGQSDYEQQVKRLRHAFTELKKAGKQISIKALEDVMGEFSNQKEDKEEQD